MGSPLEGELLGSRGFVICACFKEVVALGSLQAVGNTKEYVNL